MKEQKGTKWTIATCNNLDEIYRLMLHGIYQTENMYYIPSYYICSSKQKEKIYDDKIRIMVTFEGHE